MDLIKDLIYTFLKFLQRDPHAKIITTNRSVLRLSPRVVRFIVALTAQCKLRRRPYYKRIQRGSVNGVWYAESACKRTEEQIANGSGPVILYFHGGAFISGQAKMWTDWSVDLIQNHKKRFNKDLALFCVDYTLAPDACFPVQWHQCRTAVDYCMRSLAIHPARLFLAGDSAGANLCLQTLFELKSAKDLAGAILFSPWVLPARSLVLKNLVTDKDNIKPDSNGSWFANGKIDYVTEEFGCQGIAAYAGNSISLQEVYSSPQFNPLLRSKEEFSKLPSTVVIYGDGEVLRDEIEMFVDKAKDSIDSFDVLSEPNGVHDWALSEQLSKDPISYHKGVEFVSDWVERKMIRS